jgi:hypothetical protein
MKKSRCGIAGFALSLFALALLLSSLSVAQVDTGTILGTVRDATGAVIPGAAITLTSQSQGVSFRTTTNSEGNYQFPAIRVGQYTVAAEAPGFAAARRENVSVNIQQRYVADFSLNLSSVTQSVDVTAEAAQLQTQEASLGGTVQAQTINDLPLNGRNYTFLAQLNTGVVQSVQDSRNFNSTGSFAANGQDSFSNNYLLDGVDNNSNLSDYINGSTYAYRPSVDALQEFKVQTSSYSAEFGRAGGGVLNASIKSGTDQYHGNLFEFFRNKALDASNFFDNYQGLKKGQFIRNQFGGTFGGPVPKLARGDKKTFFFGDYEGTRTRQAQTYLLNTPTALMRSSNFTNFSELLTQGGSRTDRLGRSYPLGTIFDPATSRLLPAGSVDPVTGRTVTGSGSAWIRDPIDPTGHNVIPAGRIDQNALKLMQAFPGPTRAGLNQNFAVNPVTQDDNSQGDVRIDQYLSQKDTMFYRFSISRNTQIFPPPYGAVIDGSTFSGNNNQINSMSHAASWTHIFSSSVVAEFRYGYTGLDMARDAVNAADLGAAQQFGFQTPQVAGMGGLPTFTVAGIGQFGTPRWVPTRETQDGHQLGGTISKLWGAHSMKFGAQYLRPATTFYQPRAPRGAYFYNGVYTEIANTSGGNTGVAQMLLTPTASTLSGIGTVCPPGTSSTATPCKANFAGGPDQIQADNIPNPVPNNVWSIYSGFFDDVWKLSNKLTVNLGLRYDFVKHSDAIDGLGAEVIHDPTPQFVMAREQCNKNLSPSFLALTAKDGISIVCHPTNNLVKSPKNLWAPRIGFAYNFSDKWVVRAGGGFFYQTTARADIIRTVNQQYPVSYGVNLANFTPGEPIFYGDGSRANFTSGMAPIRVDDPLAFNASNLSLSGYPNPWKVPYSMQYNLTIQRQLTASQTVSAGYVGSQSRFGGVSYNYNSPQILLPPGTNTKPYRQFPDFSSFSQSVGGANGNFNSLQLTYDKRFTHGFAGKVNYTFSKCRTQARQPLVDQTGGSRNIWLLGPDYGLCGWDAPHAFNVNGSFNLPFGSGAHFLSGASGALNQVVGGWKVNTIFSFQSGNPFTIPCNVTTAAGSSCNAVLTGQPLYPKDQSFEHWLNPAAFANPSSVVTTIGQADLTPLGGGPTQVRGPAWRRLDLSLFKDFPVTERQRFEFRAEVFNLTNTPNFGIPGFSGAGGGGLPPPPGVLDFSNLNNFGKITTLRAGSNDQRQIQLALKYYF